MGLKAIFTSLSVVLEWRWKRDLGIKAEIGTMRGETSTGLKLGLKWEVKHYSQVRGIAD